MALIDPEDARPLSAPALRPPSWAYPFGTDRQGRDLFAAMVVGTPLTLRIGFIAGILGVMIGTILAFVAGFYRGIVDTLIRGIADIGLTVPGLLILIIIAVSVRGGLTVNQMALVVASLAWLNPDANHPLPGADIARTRLCRSGAPVRHERTGNHLFRNDSLTCCRILARRW